MATLQGDIVRIWGIAEKILSALLWRRAADSPNTVNEKYRTDPEAAKMQI